jgi:type I restriction enzyme S subunit
MKLPAYPKYKPSGVEWLGDVPEQWEVKRLKYSASINDETLPETTEPDFEFRYVDIGGVNSVSGIVAEEELIFENAPSRARRVVRNGDTIVSTVRTYLRAIAPIKNPPKNLIVSTGFAVVRPRSVQPEFLSYAIREASFVETVVARSTGVSYPAVNATEVGTIPIPLPSAAEQQAIANFLDRERARLDALVGKKQKLIERLKEKRTALISRTVTRGLPPAAARAVGLPANPPLKPSGLEWIGEIPKHWGRVYKLARLASRRKHSFVNGPFGSDLLTSEISDEGVPVIYIRDISAGLYCRTSEGCVTPEKAKELNFCRVDPGDVLVAKVGDPPGAAAVYPASEPCGIVTQDVIRLRVDKSSVSASYVAYFLNSFAGRGLIDQISIESTRVRVSLGDYKSSLCVVPPLPEQAAIAEFLDRETAKLDALVAKVKAAVERLQEYRTALITAAVTGKIDVRKESHGK